LTLYCTLIFSLNRRRSRARCPCGRRCAG